MRVGPDPSCRAPYGSSRSERRSIRFHSAQRIQMGLLGGCGDPNFASLDAPQPALRHCLRRRAKACRLGDRQVQSFLFSRDIPPSRSYCKKWSMAFPSYGRTIATAFGEPNAPVPSRRLQCRSQKKARMGGRHVRVRFILSTFNVLPLPPATMSPRERRLRGAADGPCGSLRYVCNYGLSRRFDRMAAALARRDATAC